MYTHLCLSGGGTKGICTVGALQALHEKDLMIPISTFIGTSSGAIICFFINNWIHPK